MIIIFNKLSIEIDKFNKNLNIQYINENKLKENKSDFDRIHMNLFKYDNIIQKKDNLNIKFIFKRFEIEIDKLKILKH